MSYSDQKYIFEYAKNPKIAEHVLWDAHKTEFDTIQFLNMVYDAYNHNKAAPWGIQLIDDIKIIGTVGFVSYDHYTKEAEVGYALAEDYWGRGIITEALNAVIEFGFEKMDLNLITARCKPRNTASYRVLEKAGFNFMGIIEKQMEIKGRLEDMRIYSLSKDEYKGRS